MSNDLISRSAATEEFYKRVSGDLTIEDVQYIEKVIESIPVAYDLNGIIGKLQEANKMIAEMAEEIENCYGRETDLTEKARNYLANMEDENEID